MRTNTRKFRLALTWLMLVALLSFLVASSASAATIELGSLSWSVQYMIDQSQSVFGDSQFSGPRDNRGLALSPDGRYLYAGYNNPSSGASAKQVRKIDTTIPDYIDATIAVLKGFRGKAIATDDVGRVYLAEGSAGIYVYDPSLATQLTTIPVGTTYGLSKPEGVAATREDGFLVLYVTDRANKTLTRFEITEGPGYAISEITKAGEITITGASDLRGVEVDRSGRIWMADCDEGKVFRVNSDGTGLTYVTVPNAMDIGFDNTYAFVTQYTERTITVLRQSDMSFVTTLTPPWEQLKLDPDGESGNGALSGIAIGPGSFFYVANEAGQTADEHSTYGRIDGQSGYIGGIYYTDTTHDDNEPILKAMAPPAEVWVDVDYCEGCTNDGHTWGYDAFNKIQDGIDAVAEGGTVYVAAGTYYEVLTIDKTLTLQGDPSDDRPKIEFPDTDKDGITIKADNVTLENLWLYRAGHSYYHAIIGVPKGGSWPDYTIVTQGLTVKNCLIEGGRYSMYVSVKDMTVENCIFKEPYRDGIVTAGIAGTTTITHNHFIGAASTKQAIYMTTGPGTPYDSGTLNISYNTHTGGGHFFLVDYWGWDEVNAVDLQIIHNSIDQIGNRKGVVFYAAYAEDPQGFPKFHSITIQDNIFSNCGPAVYVDYQDWGGAPSADSRTIPSSGQIVVDNNLTHNVTAETNDTMDATGAYGYYDAAGMTPPGASLAMFDLSDNIVGDPLYEDADHGGICFEYWALQYGSPAVGTASDGTNIGAWQGTPSTTTMTSFLVDDAKFDCKKEDGGKVHVRGELELDRINGDGVEISDDVVVTVGTWSYTINMVEKGKEGEHWEYNRPKGNTGGIKHMRIDWNKGTFDFEMDGLDLSGVERPVTISVQIGDDLGQATVLTSKLTEVTIDLGKKDDGAKVHVKGELGFGPVCGPYDSPTSDITMSVEQGDTKLSWTISQGDIEVKGKEGEHWEYKPDKHTDTVFKHAKVDWKRGTFDFDLDDVDVSSLDLGQEVKVNVTIEGNIISETVLLTGKGRRDQWKPLAVEDQLRVVMSPNPIRDVHTAHFYVMGAMADEVEEIRVQIYDLSGRLVWEDTAPGSELEWHTEDLSGTYLANGVYLYKVQIRVDGSWISQELGKIVVLR